MNFAVRSRLLAVLALLLAPALPLAAQKPAAPQARRPGDLRRGDRGQRRQPGRLRDRQEGEAGRRPAQGGLRGAGGRQAGRDHQLLRREPRRRSGRGGIRSAAGSRPPRRLRSGPLDQRLRLVVFVDDVNLTAANRTRILQNAGRFLHTELKPGDEVMLVRYTESSDIRRQFTADLGALDADLAAMLKLQHRHPRIPAEPRQRHPRASATRISGMASVRRRRPRMSDWAAHESSMVRGALNAVDSVVSWLAGVPGRKAILYVSDGLPLVPGLDLFTIYTRAPQSSEVSKRTPEMVAQRFDLTTRFRADHRARQPQPGHLLSDRGLRHADRRRHRRGCSTTSRSPTARTGSASSPRTRAAGRCSTPPTCPARSPAWPRTSRTTTRSATSRSGRATRRSTRSRCGRRPRGVQVRTRQWYRDKPVGEVVAEATLAVMRFGPEDNPLGAALEVVPGKKAGEMLVRVKVPVAKLYLQPQEGSRQGHLRLYVVAAGEGSTTPVRETRTATVEVPEAEAAAGTKTGVHPRDRDPPQARQLLAGRRRARRAGRDDVLSAAGLHGGGGRERGEAVRGTLITPALFSQPSTRPDGEKRE